MANIGIGVIIDLDDTLVVTRALEAFRRNRDWKKCYEEFSRTHLPEGTHAFLNKLREFAVCGVVTTSPRPYAERLIAFHALKIEVLVAYYDVKLRKPHPEPLLLGAQRLHIPIDKCVHIGDSESDVLAARSAGAKSLSVCWTGYSGCEPAFRKWSDVLKQIEMFSGGANELG
jgi:HAD superfamily hydrolase (TIGR01549 family)